MKRFAFACFIILALSGFNSVQSQSSELCVFGGIASTKGDINRTLFQARFFNPAYGLRFRHCYNNHWAINISATQGKVEGDDLYSGSAYQRYRNLRFFSNVTEVGLNLEFNFFKFQTANPKTHATPYLFVGYNGFYFNPKAELNGVIYKLQPLGTEGQGTSGLPNSKKYNRLSRSFGFGGGAKFRLGRRFGLVLESGARKTSTDFLDDVSGNYASKPALAAENGAAAALLSDPSIDQGNNNNYLRQRGNINDNDWYFFGGVSITFTLSKNYHNVCRPFKIQLH